jgi:hypothetical protein
MLHLVDVKRIRQETHVKDQIRIRRDPVFEAEGQDGNKQGIVILVLLEDLDQFFLQLPVSRLDVSIT